MNVAVFPLTANVLPNGRLPLRIFEPRYLRMVAEVSKQKQLVGMALLKPQRELPDDQNFYDIVTLCEIADFSLLDDGLLGVEMKGVSLAMCSNVSIDFDGLHRADVELLDFWPSNPASSTQLHGLSVRLETIFKEYPEVGQLYANDMNTDDLRWVCSRWIEILPLAPHVKYKLIRQPVQNVAEYLEALLLKR